VRGLLWLLPCVPASFFELASGIVVQASFHHRNIAWLQGAQLEHYLKLEWRQRSLELLDRNDALRSPHPSNRCPSCTFPLNGTEFDFGLSLRPNERNNRVIARDIRSGT